MAEMLFGCIDLFVGVRVVSKRWDLVNWKQNPAVAKWLERE
jgi:hypothetical protein